MHISSQVIAIVGPTASGKTNLSINLAKKIDGEIVSADSRQIYKELNIGVAKPSTEELSTVKHHMINIVSIKEPFSVAQYADMARPCIDNIINRGKVAILCGGTGLYIDSILNNIKFTKTPINLDLRNNLIKLAREKGGEFLLAQLKTFDPITASKLNKNDIKRITRAIEVYKTTGKTIYQHELESKLTPFKYEYKIIGLFFEKRQNLYDRINSRVNDMISKGLENEARKILKTLSDPSEIDVIGYNELFDYINGKISLDCAINLIKQNTRRYAKRQLTWFRKNEKITKIYVDTLPNQNTVFKEAEKILRGENSI